MLGVVGVILIRSNGAIPGLDTYSVGALLLLLRLIALASSAWRAGLMQPWVLGALVRPGYLGLSATSPQAGGHCSRPPASPSALGFGALACTCGEPAAKPPCPRSPRRGRILVAA